MVSVTVLIDPNHSWTYAGHGAAELFDAFDSGGSVSRLNVWVSWVGGCCALEGRIADSGVSSVGPIYGVGLTPSA